MNRINNGGPAFPTDSGGGRFESHDGMSLRDYFAGQALAGIMGDPDVQPSSVEEFARMATRLYQVADAMLAARTPEGSR